MDFQDFNTVCLLQVDTLKSTALPLMKKFGIDGEGFDLKVKTSCCIFKKHDILFYYFLFDVYSKCKYIVFPATSLNPTLSLSLCCSLRW